MPPGDREASLRAGADVATLEGGAIVSLHSYYDQVELMTRLGLMPQA